jgi:ferrous iron transport protein B
MSARNKGAQKKIVVAIGGNPNSGKTTIFNELTGSRQRVGNWGGVTVEKKEGIVEHRGYRIVFVDLPGTYSLTAYSLEEIIARNFIVNEKPDVVVDVIDAGNLERNLYLAVQLIEMGGKFVFVLNMADMAEKQGLLIHREKLATLLGGPVVFTIGHRGKGITELLDEVVKVYEGREKKSRHLHVAYGNELEEEVRKIQGRIRTERELTARYSTRWLAVKLIEDDSEVKKMIEKESARSSAILTKAEESRKHLRNIFSEEPESLVADQRYGFISGLLQECISLNQMERVDSSQKIDRVLTNRLLGIPLLIFFIWLMFQITYRVGAYPMRWIEYFIELGEIGIKLLFPAGVLRSLLIDGIISGVGGVAVFLPNILLLFFLISLFEDTGYMARAAFVMDRVMHLIGLHGKSFISMIMGFGCNVPAIMGTRTLENEKDRILTILINPLMSCSARLPVYVLIAGAFFGRRAGNVIFSVYAVGVVLAILIGRLFRKTLFRGESEPFVMELPPYRIPTIKSVVIHMWERAFIFVKKMGTVILAGSIVIWFLSNFPIPRDVATVYRERVQSIEEIYRVRIDELKKSAAGYRAEKRALNEEKSSLIAQLQQERASEIISQSFIGRIGRFIEPVFRPLGFSWREGVALITGFVAKEVVVSTLGILYNAGGEAQLGYSLRKSSSLTPLSAYAFLIFVLIYTPCLATVAVIRQETKSFKWTLFTILYEISLAWVLSFLIVKGGGLLLSLI